MGNANSGRKPKPTSLKILQGNPGQRKLNLYELKPVQGPVVKPEGLSVHAGKVWERLAPVCIQMGTLTAADIDPFATLCELQGNLDLARAAKNAPDFAPFTLSEDYNGAPKMGLHAAIKLEKDLAPAIRPYYEYFGLTVASRARMQVLPKEEPVSKWAGALK